MTRTAARAVRRARALPQQVRIIGGSLKRSVVPVLDRPGLRPTPQRVRETLFNWLGQDLTGWRCLDAFAGSGALGFEAASRGAASVVMLERDPDLVASLQAVQARLGARAVTVERGDSLAWIRSATRNSFELVLLDPPFDDSGLLRVALQAAAHLVAEGGYIYVEAARPLQLWPDGFILWRQARAGAVHFHLLRRQSSNG
ncbi:MAG TPA: 16S rRNA (guanine(966)-N(2))-methyltransferase RsmD [Burkholderiaceae bacterium]|nr:16S rRNA (guanine(966)-N(2))-methyltransferase RsmD [Burkholderiaceae bacterium]